MDADVEPSIATDDVLALARLAGLPLDAARAAALVPALAADLRVIYRLRGVPVSDIHPADWAALPAEHADER